jgi:hypothetical protein
LAHNVADRTPDTFVKSAPDDGEELIAGSESAEKSAPVFEKFEERKEGE